MRQETSPVYAQVLNTKTTGITEKTKARHGFMILALQNHCFITDKSR